MTKTTRREFLKELAILPVLALPRPKGDALAPEVQQNDKALLTGIERANTKLIDNANFDVAIEETANFLDALKDTVTTIEARAEALTGEPDVTIFNMLDDFNRTVMAQADAPPGEPLDSLEVLVDPNLYGQFERAFDHTLARRWGDIEPGATVYLSWDKGNSWERMGNLERLFDSCECAPMEWHVEYKQCESPKWEYVKCPDCGSDNWVWNDGFRCLDCGAEGVDPCSEKGAR